MEYKAFSFAAGEVRVAFKVIAAERCRFDVMGFGKVACVIGKAFAGMVQRELQRCYGFVQSLVAGEGCRVGRREFVVVGENLVAEIAQAFQAVVVDVELHLRAEQVCCRDFDFLRCANHTLKITLNVENVAQ